MDSCTYNTEGRCSVGRTTCKHYDEGECIVETHNQNKPYISGELSIGNILTVLALLFSFGGFYAMTTYRMEQFERVIEIHTKDITQLQIDLAVEKTIQKNYKN